MAVVLKRNWFYNKYIYNKKKNEMKKKVEFEAACKCNN